MPNRSTWLAAAAATAVLCTQAAAATYTFQHGVAGYAGGTDTQLRASDPDFAYGSEFEIGVDASDGGMPTQALLRFGGLFGAAPGQIGADQEVVSATLRVLVTSAGSGILFHEMLRPWDEATITWNSAVSGIQADGVEAELLPFLAVGANDGNGNIESGWLELDVTVALQRLQRGQVPGHGWALLPFMPSGTNGVDFYTREWVELSERPLLTVTTAPIPEPATLALLLGGLGGIAATVRRRRG